VLSELPHVAFSVAHQVLPEPERLRDRPLQDVGSARHCLGVVAVDVGDPDQYLHARTPATRFGCVAGRSTQHHDGTELGLHLGMQDLTLGRLPQYGTQSEDLF
jgi:hypothetical protein